MSAAKVGTKMKRVRRVLPSIPPTETRIPRMPPTEIRDQSSIQPTVVKPLTKFRGACRKPMLPSLPTIEEQASPTAVEETTPLASVDHSDQDSALAENKASLALKEGEKGALPRLQGTVEMIKNSRQSRDKEEFPRLRKREAEHALDQKALWPPSAKGNNAIDQCSEREETKKFKQREEENKVSRIELSRVDSYALLSRKWKESSSQLHNTKRRENEEKRSYQPTVNRSDKKQLSVGSYAMLNLKRKELEALTPSLELIAGRHQTRTKPSTKGGNDRILTVKPALPSIGPTHESTAGVPHPPTAPKIKKGRVHTGIQATMRRPLPHIQPIVKQALPGLNSSSLQELVKKPLPSVQPQEDFCSPGAVQATAKSDSQTLTAETERNTGAEQQ